MIPQLRAETKKLLSVRSTYAIAGFFILLLGFVAFYGQGFKTPASGINSLFLAGTIPAVGNLASVPGALIALLLMAHEYRYNTITYTLTSSNSRSKVIASKILVVLGFVLIFSVIVTAMFLVLSAVGLVAAGHSLPHQDINYLAFFGKVIFFAESYAMAGLLVPTLVRNMQASVAVLFIVPNTLEQLLGLLIKQPERWLPFSALAQVVNQPVVTGPKGHIPVNHVSPLRGGVTFLIYLVIGWSITWYLFLRRDSS